MNLFQQLEQVQAGLRDIAPVLASYKENLIKQGFKEEEAFILVRDYHNSIFNNK